MLPFVVAANTVTTALVAAGGVVLGAVLALAGTVFTARSKLAELRLSHAQKLAGEHLQAARAHTKTVYIPLNASLTNLQNAFLVLRERSDGTDPEQDGLDSFRDASSQFLDDVKDITANGQDAFLTTDLDTRLGDFAAFLRASQTATDVSGKVVVQTFGASLTVQAGGFWFRALRNIELASALTTGTEFAKSMRCWPLPLTQASSRNASSAICWQ